MTELMEIHLSEIKNHMDGRKEQGQNVARHFTLWKYFKNITQISFFLNEICYASHHCALSLSALRL